MIQLLLHAWGDYIIQNDWMATNKTKRTTMGVIACLIHAITYSIPFAFICESFWQWIIICTTHFFIDHYRLAVPLIRLKNWCWDKESTTGFPVNTPVWLSVWLVIIVDNILHITINYVTLTYL